MPDQEVWEPQPAELRDGELVEDSHAAVTLALRKQAEEVLGEGRRP